MAHHRLKATLTNINSLWFGADTPIRQYKIKSNPELWEACQRVSRVFKAPSGASTIDYYTKSDKSAFARAVQQKLYQPTASQQAYYCRQLEFA
ncbi:hypothetical protein GO730_17755 [Spirosoma sp. HMF3257]|uniref:Uncharacterized protein n=1 Tax=Spirosoma telluris TaxID=2183553 RepID=A0A327NK50_9BACT|nr:hypothetical protein [Spirosoma telluris]RAI75542.1 hypothetical protein HMF3257_17675 [Spirosoma telluris]